MLIFCLFVLFLYTMWAEAFEVELGVGNLIALEPFDKCHELILHLEIDNAAALVATEVCMLLAVAVETAERVVNGEH